MKLKSRTKLLYDKIGVYKIAMNMSESYRFNERFEGYSNDDVLRIIQEIGYSVKFMSKENFFKITESVSDLLFYCHFSCKYALVEFIFGVRDKNKIHLEGGALSTICKLIEMSEGINKEGYVQYPGFRNYEELRNILRQYFRLYEDFKREFLALVENTEFKINEA